MAMVINRFDVYLKNLDPTIDPEIQLEIISVLQRLFAF